MNPIVKLALTTLGPRAMKWWQERQAKKTAARICGKPCGQPPEGLRETPFLCGLEVLHDGDHVPSIDLRRPVVVLPEGQTLDDLLTRSRRELVDAMAAAPGARSQPLELTITGNTFARVECPLCGRDVAITRDGITFLHRTRPGTRDHTVHAVRMSDKVVIVSGGADVAEVVATGGSEIGK